MIYTAIKTLEKRWPLFNREPFTKAHCLKLLEHMGVIALTDRQVPEAMALWHEKKAFVVYNPHLSDSDLVLNIGHELGHFALGRIKFTRLPTLSRIFSKTIEEKDAGIIGFLMWAPTFELCRIRQGPAQYRGTLPLRQIQGRGHRAYIQHPKLLIRCFR